ncbi:MAG TPA: hypothetical protein VKG89_07540 [Solirubrobacterales bacterium]|nr:hypothetical protein [Solirubrobacterales bacterium]
MPKTSGDKLFERYLREHGYEPGAHEPDLAEYAIAKRPDFLPRLGELRIACEVEQFTAGASALERRLADQRTISASGKEVYGPIRNHVAKAAQQLKPLTALQLPLVVVLANPEGAMLDLSVQHVLSALYGNPTFTMDVDPAVGAAVGDGRLEFGRDGKLTNDHPYLSAVALLRRREHRADRISEIADEERGGRDPSGFDEATAEALQVLKRLDREDPPEGDYLYVDLIETVSEKAVPLPREWFAGEHDSRWRLRADGYFELVNGQRRS